MRASEHLVGLVLDGDWIIVRQLAREPGHTGGTFSRGYIAERKGEFSFVKALDYADAFQPGVNTAKALQEMTAAFLHEREVLEVCKEKRLSRVVAAIAAGEIQVPSFSPMEGRVQYLMFEMAEFDVRSQMDLSERHGTLWCIQALADVSLALFQIHKELIAHQDIKPSNILFCKQNSFKLADFGRSSRRGRSIWWDDFAIAGDQSYAPFEQLYGYRDPDFVKRRVGCDLFMFGNLSAFLFSGTNVTANVLSRLEHFSS
jgi:serine/threonine protein kinase